MSNGIYNVEDYTGSDYAKITAAINAATSAGGGKVLLSNRTYSISQSIVLHSNIVFCGVGVASSIVCSADVPVIRIDRNVNDSFFISICDMKMSYGSTNTSNCFHVEADRPVHLKIYNVVFRGPGRQHSGVLTWNASTGNKTQMIAADANNASFMTHIENCVFSSASIWLNDSDSRILNNYVWSKDQEIPNNNQYAIRLTNGAVNVSGNDIVAGDNAGVYLAPTCDGIRIENNYFDGSWDDVVTGWAISLSSAKRVLVLGNYFNYMYSGGVLVSGSSEQITISKNTFRNINRSGSTDSNYDIKIIAGGVRSIGHIVEGNQHYRDLSAGQNYALSADNNVEVAIINNSLIDNIPNTGAYVKPAFYKWTDKYSIRENNRVTYYTLAQGTPPIETRLYPFQFDEGEVAVQHSSSVQSTEVHFSSAFSSQNITPKVQDIHINFVGGSSTSAVAYSVWGVSATGFNIAFRPIGNSTTDGVFSWRVTLQ